MPAGGASDMMFTEAPLTPPRTPVRVPCRCLLSARYAARTRAHAPLRLHRGARATQRAPVAGAEMASHARLPRSRARRIPPSCFVDAIMMHHWNPQHSVCYS